MDILQLESVSKALRRNIRPFDVQQYLRLTSEDVSKVAVKFMQGGNKGFDFEGLAEALLQLAHEDPQYANVMVVRNQHGTWVLLTVLDSGLHSSCATLCALARSPVAAAVMRLVDTWAQTQRPALAQLWTERRANLLRLDWLSRVLAQNAKSATVE